MVHTAKRLGGQAVWERISRAAFLTTLQPILAELAARNADRVDFVVAACADTALLSTLAHAAYRADGTLFDRSHFTVLDRCRTPLTLCKDYAEEHGLQIQTEIVDLLDTSKTFPADIIALHNFLPFVPQDMHIRLLQMLGSWLKETGCIMIWNPVLPSGDQDRSESRRKDQGAEIMALVNSGVIEIDEPTDVFLARLNHNLEDPRVGGQRFTDIDSLPNLIRSAGLQVRSVEDIRDHGGYRNLLYTIVVAERPSS